MPSSRTKIDSYDSNKPRPDFVSAELPHCSNKPKSMSVESKAPSQSLFQAPVNVPNNFESPECSKVPRSAKEIDHNITDSNRIALLTKLILHLM